MPNPILIVLGITLVLVLAVIMRKALSTKSESGKEKQPTTFPPKPTQVRPLENLLSYIPKSITFESTRQNSGNGSNTKGKNITPKEELYSTGISIKSNGKGGTKSSPQNATSVKQRLNVFVSNSQIFSFYHQPDIDDEKAERIIDAKLATIPEASGYTKSTRRKKLGVCTN